VKELWKNVTPMQALNALAQNYGCQVLSGPGLKSQLFIYAGGPVAFNLPVTKVSLLDKTPAGGPLTQATNGEDDADVDVTIDNLPATEAIRQLAITGGLSIQIDPLRFSPADDSHRRLPYQGRTPILAATPDGRGQYARTPFSKPEMPGPLVNDKYTNATARQEIQRLLDKYGLQLTRIVGNPILRVVAQDPKPPDATGKPDPPK